MAQTPASKLAHAVDEVAAVLFGIRLGQHNSCARGKNLTIFVGEAGVDSQLLPLSSPRLQYPASPVMDSILAARGSNLEKVKLSS
jgi:hypothetical protein